MTEQTRKPRPRPAAVDPDEDEAPDPACNVPGCDETAEFRGLCPAHRQTHRGLLDPKEPPR
jgi:hypothetical protein